MATYSTALKTARMQAIVNTIDAGAGPGTLEIGTTGMGSVLATFTLTDPCGTVAGDTLTFDFDPDIEVNASAAGVAAEARIRDSDSNIIISGITVGTSGTEIIIINTNIAAGQPVVLQSGTIQHAA